jgi:hypothetical protein
MESINMTQLRGTFKQFFAVGPDLKYPWFDRELHNLDTNKTKAHKFVKRVSRTYERTGYEENNAEFHVASARFQNLRGDFKLLHRMKYNRYIEGIESGINSYSRSFFKFSNMKRNSSGYPSSMFFESQSARGPEEVVKLFAEFFQGVCISEDVPVSLPMLDTLPDKEHELHMHKVLLVQFTQTAVDGAILRLDE